MSWVIQTGPATRKRPQPTSESFVPKLVGHQGTLSTSHSRTSWTTGEVGPPKPALRPSAGHRTTIAFALNGVRGNECSDFGRANHVARRERHARGAGAIAQADGVHDLVHGVIGFRQEHAGRGRRASADST